VIVQVPTWVIVAATLLAALPFGWGLGVLAAYLIGGRDFGQLPVATVPLGLLAAFVLALWPGLPPAKRLKVMVAGAAASIIAMWLLG
jgi:hypothetical protein